MGNTLTDQWKTGIIQAVNNHDREIKIFEEITAKLKEAHLDLLKRLNLIDGTIFSLREAVKDLYSQNKEIAKRLENLEKKNETRI